MSRHDASMPMRQICALCIPVSMRGIGSVGGSVCAHAVFAGAASISTRAAHHPAHIRFMPSSGTRGPPLNYTTNVAAAQRLVHECAWTAKGIIGPLGFGQAHAEANVAVGSKADVDVCKWFEMISKALLDHCHGNHGPPL